MCAVARTEYKSLEHWFYGLFSSKIDLPKIDFTQNRFAENQYKALQTTYKQNAESMVKAKEG